MKFDTKDKTRILAALKSTGSWDGTYSLAGTGGETYMFRCEGAQGERRIVAEATKDGQTVTAEGAAIDVLLTEIAAAVAFDGGEFYPPQAKSSPKRTESPAPIPTESRQDEIMNGTHTTTPNTDEVTTAITVSKPARVKKSKKAAAFSPEPRQDEVVKASESAPEQKEVETMPSTKTTKKAAQKAAEPKATATSKKGAVKKANPAIEKQGDTYRWFGHAVGRVLHWMGANGFNAFEAANIMKHYGLPELTKHSLSSRIAEGRSEKWRNPAELDKAQIAELKTLRKQFKVAA